MSSESTRVGQVDGKRMELLSRRSLLRGVGAGALALPLTAAMAGEASAAPLRRTFTRSSFSPRVGSAFTTRSRLGVATFTLVAIGDLANSRAGAEKQFSLQLQLTRGRWPGQGTFVFQNRQLGKFAMFVVPVGRKQGAFEAVFNAR